MRSQAHARIIILSGAALLLGAWNLIGPSGGPRPAAAPASTSASASASASAAPPTTGMPTLAPQLIGDGPRAAGAAGRSVPLPAARGNQPARPAAGPGDGTAPALPVWSARGMPDVAYGQLLDRVFAPDRTAREPSPSDAFAPAMAALAAVAAPAGPSAAAGDAEVAAVRRRQGTEKSYYEDYLALAKSDAQELERQATTVLQGAGEPCQQVAMLRALYETDRSRALAGFAQAIVYLSERPRAEGVSVPTFAVTFLCQRLADPAVKGMVERIAWTGYLNVPPELRQQAVQSLLATATPADLQRYAAYPAYAALTGSDGTR